MSVFDVNNCILQLDAAKTDEERFAAIFLVPKVVNAGECEPEQLHQLFKAIGFPFLQRLLKSKPAEGCPETLYQSIALNILVCFCSNQDLVKDSEMFECIPLLNHIITQTNPAEDTDELLNSCYTILNCIALTNKGRTAIITKGTVAALCRIIAEEGYSQQDKALDILKKLALMCRNETWCGNEKAMEVLLSTLAAQLKNDQSAKKFETCETLWKILSTISPIQVSSLSSSKNWMSDIHEVVVEVLQSKLGTEQRRSILQLASVMVGLVDIDWILRSPRTSPGTLGADGDSARILGDDVGNTKILLLLIHLTCVEVRMALEDQPFYKVVEDASILSTSYTLLENVISYMMCGPSLALGSQQVLQVHSALVGAFNAVTYFLSTVSQEYPEEILHPVVMASVRVLGSWIAEETTALKKEVLKILPFLMKVCKKSFETDSDLTTAAQGMGTLHITNGQSDSSSTPHETITFKQSDADLTLSTNDESTDVILATTDSDIIRFLLPGLCHLTADDETRKILLQENVPEFLIGYYFHKWSEFEENSKMHETEVTLITLCGSLLNLTILERKILSSSEEIKQLLHHIILHLPALDSKSCVVLSYNLNTLGLMMLHTLVTDPGVTEQELSTFLDSSIAMLSGVHTCYNELTSGKAVCVISLHVQEHWFDIRELWVLGMQALSELVGLHKHLCRKILHSDWLLSLLSLLFDVDGSTVDEACAVAYCQLLYELSKTDVEMKKVIQENRGLHIAQKYKDGMLEQILAGKGGT